MDDVLQIEGLTKTYGAKAALQGVSLAIAHNEYVSLLGPSGSGKTVLLRLIAGFEPPDSGRIWVDGKDISRVLPHDRGIGFVFQNFALFPHLNVYENIAFGLSNRVHAPIADGAELRARVNAMIDLVGLGGFGQRGVHQISGGQRQRVALARTLVTEPRLVLLDEPLGALDANLRMRMRGELRRIRSLLGVTFLHVTGSETEALAMGDRSVVLDNGRIGQFDRPDVIFNQPVSPNVARFLNCYNVFGGVIEGGSFRSGGHVFGFSGPVKPGAETAYVVRQDVILIQAMDAPVGARETGLSATYVTSEYTGAAFMYFFKTDDGHIVEVENHLSHRAAQDLVAGARYRLVWRADAALVYG
jgi:ABC-type Fe3+/spermidine/putrescine transport system ATPase subunit